MDDVDRRIAAAVTALQDHGAVFAYLHGRRAAGTATSKSDTDIAAYFDAEPPEAFAVLLPPGIDLVVLNGAPLELAGRVRKRSSGPVGRLAGAVGRPGWESLRWHVFTSTVVRIVAITVPQRGLNTSAEFCGQSFGRAAGAIGVQPSFAQASLEAPAYEHRPQHSLILDNITHIWTYNNKT
ncbi:nucleotidyltransferase domain-containing protein [Mycolicibacter algericus]|uniref:nucleotidyltransferase domain-containing protein n=1 Tax=Mycolicibacter algericus TaxID=1288388 RepID=UPI003C77F15D